MIKTPFGTYNGDSWEEHCQIILKMKYENEGYQEMTAHTNGDLGIEGFTRSGIVFQCYCPDNEYETKVYYNHQRDKVTKDLKKLKTYKKQLLNYFRNIKIKKWIFLTPKIPNKDLIAHCHSKAIELREDDSMKELLDVEFDVLAHDENFYVTEILRAKNILNQKVKFDVEIPSEEEIIDWRQCQSESIITLSNKIEKLFPDSDKEKKQKQVNKYVNIQIRNYIKGQELLNKMQQTYNLSYEKQARIKSTIADHLETESLITDLSPKKFIEKTMEKYRAALIGEKFDEQFEFSVYENLLHEAVASWLIDCPLDFGGED
ncbi:hypothetical protein [Alkalihalobacillus pseudalcaliphilus]|uniref:hypothetical protein n=1 Tax=Alkalihalobacillus pseudalcaliphilus TaxID=79884 RepID=UPI00069F896D|nr:hypothetical protein [Alkalihalobacillus pseudalcaliphilus]